MEQPRTEDFDHAKSTGVSLTEIIARARQAASEINGLPVDSISKCERDPGGEWRVLVDLIESPARMGENDLLAAVEVVLSADGDLSGIERKGRYRREEGGLR